MAKAKDHQSAAVAAAFYSTPSNITTLYRQNLSHFLSHSHASLGYPTDDPINNSSTTTSWIDHTARSLALRAATTLFAPGETPTGNNPTQNDQTTKKSRKKSSTNNTKEVSAVDNIVRTLPPQWSDFVCMTCGTFLFPPKTTLTSSTDDNITDYGNNGSTAMSSINFQISQATTLLPSNIYIRPLKRGRTRRRRASRSKATHLHNHSLSMQRRGGTSNGRNIQLNKGTLEKEEIRRIASSYCVGDGRAKNCLVMSCTFCGTKTKRKGVEVDKKNGGGRTTTTVVVGRVEQNSGVRKKRYEKHQPQNESRGESSRGNVTSQIRDNSDFISLSPMMMMGGVGNNRKSVGQQQTPDWKDVHNTKTRNSDDFLTSPLLLGGKKKKKKKPDVKKKGELMDFLSSLND